MLLFFLMHVLSFGSDITCSSLFDPNPHTVESSNEIVLLERIDTLADEIDEQYGWTLRVDDDVEFHHSQQFHFASNSRILYLSPHLFSSSNFKDLFTVLEHLIPQHIKRKNEAQQWMQEKFGLNVDANGFIDPINNQSRFARIVRRLKAGHRVQVNLTDSSLDSFLLGFAQGQFYIALYFKVLEPTNETLNVGFLVHEATHTTTDQRLQSDNLTYENFLYYSGRSIRFMPMKLSQDLLPLGYNTNSRADEYEAHRKQFLTMRQDANSLSVDLMDLNKRANQFLSLQRYWIKRILKKNSPAVVTRTDEMTRVLFIEKKWLGLAGMTVSVPIYDPSIDSAEAIDLAHAILNHRLNLLLKK